MSTLTGVRGKGGGSAQCWGPSATPPGLSPPLSRHREYRSRFTNTETLLFCMRVMVGVIILYDHVHPVGAFAKTSKIDVSCCGVHWWGKGVSQPSPSSRCSCDARGSLSLDVPYGDASEVVQRELIPPSTEEEGGEEGRQLPKMCPAAPSLSCCPTR